MTMMICIFAFVLFFFFSLYICCPLFFFFVFYVFYIDILCAVTASLSAVSCREATVCLMLAFLHFSNALYLFFVPFVLCDFVARRPHPFFASCFLSFCLSLSFDIEISSFALALALSLFYPIPTNQWIQSFESQHNGWWSWCARQRWINVLERRKCRVCLLSECSLWFVTCCWVRCIVQCLRAFCSPFFLHTCLAVLFCLIFTTVLYVVGRLAE